MFTEWPGYFSPPEAVNSAIRKISQLNEESSQEEWLDCLDALGVYDAFISNDRDGTTSFPSKLWTFAHHAAYYHAPKLVLLEMRKRKFLMSLKDFEGKMAVDHLNGDLPEDHKDLFKPTFKVENIDLIKLNKIEEHFHQLIISRAEANVKRYNLILPMLSVLLETITEEAELWFDVPGMDGGFTMGFEFNKEKTDILYLSTSSWSCTETGSGQIHKCTEDGFFLVDKGFI